MELLHELATKLARTNAERQRFSNFQGDICYFADINDIDARLALQRVGADFEDMAGLVQDILATKAFCEEAFKSVSCWITVVWMSLTKLIACVPIECQVEC